MKKKLLILGVSFALLLCIVGAGCTGNESIEGLWSEDGGWYTTFSSDGTFATMWTKTNHAVDNGTWVKNSDGSYTSTSLENGNVFTLMVSGDSMSAIADNGAISKKERVKNVESLGTWGNDEWTFIFSPDGSFRYYYNGVSDLVTNGIWIKTGNNTYTASIVGTKEYLDLITSGNTMKAISSKSGQITLYKK